MFIKIESELNKGSSVPPSFSDACEDFSILIFSL